MGSATYGDRLDWYHEPFVKHNIFIHAIRLATASTHHKFPRLIELNQFRTQSVNFISYLQIFCCGKFKSEPIHAHV
jgi:hypothetical protein